MAFWHNWIGGERRLSNAALLDGVRRLSAQATTGVQSPQGSRRQPFVLDGNPVERKKAMEYVPFFRAVNLLASQSAEVIVSTVRVVNKEKQVVKTDLARRATALIQETPDEVQSAQGWLRDMFFDLLIDGNALIYAPPSIAASGGTRYRSSLIRLNSRGAMARFADPNVGWKSLVYQATPYALTLAPETYPHNDIVHARWASQDSVYTSTNSSSFFSPSPLVHLAKAIKIGLEADSWVGDFFDNAARNDMVVEFPHDMAEGDQKKFLKYWRRSETSKRWPILSFGGAQVKLLKQTPQQAEAKELREYQVQEIGRYYGIPAPLIGSHVTQWGSGIEHLARLGYRFGTRFPLITMLDALSFRLLPRGQKFEVDSMSEVKGDMNAMTDLIQTAKPSPQGPGVMSRLEVRELLGLYGEMDDDWGYEVPDKSDGGGLDKGSEDEDNADDSTNLRRLR